MGAGGGVHLQQQLLLLKRRSWRRRRWWWSCVGARGASCLGLVANLALAAGRCCTLGLPYAILWRMDWLQRVGRG